MTVPVGPYRPVGRHRVAGAGSRARERRSYQFRREPSARMVPWTRTEVGFALLLSVPPGVGVTGFVTNVVGETTLPPTAVAAGLVTTTVIFALVAAGLRGGPAGDRA